MNLFFFQNDAQEYHLMPSPEENDSDEKEAFCFYQRRFITSWYYNILKYVVLLLVKLVHLNNVVDFETCVIHNLLSIPNLFNESE